MQKAMFITVRVLFAISGACVAYGLFVFGHSEVAAPERVTMLAAVAIVCATIGGMLMWIGLPAQKAAAKKKAGKH